jgi:hypothetical protein
MKVPSGGRIVGFLVATIFWLRCIQQEALVNRQETMAWSMNGNKIAVETRLLSRTIIFEYFGSRIYTKLCTRNEGERRRNSSFVCCEGASPVFVASCSEIRSIAEPEEPNEKQIE